MNEIKLISSLGWADSPVMGSIKKNILYAISIMCCIVFLPLAAKNFALGHHYLAAVLSLFTLALCADVLAAQADAKKPFHPHIIVGLLVLAEVMTVDVLGIYGVFWIFPTVMGLLFLLTLRIALAYSLVLVGSVVFIAFRDFEMGVALRLLISLVLLIGIAVALLNIMDKLQQKLREESIHDPLTGLLNRRQLDFHLHDAVRQFERNSRESILLLVDIDYFKKVNDSYGHAEGDRVIQQVADIITATLRETDVVFRIGGEEFLVLAKDVSVSEALAMAEKLRDAIYAAKIILSSPVSVSIGIGDIDCELNKDSWMKRADDAMYQAKKLGRNRVCLAPGNQEASA